MMMMLDVVADGMSRLDVDVDVGVADAELPALVASGAPSSSPSPSSSYSSSNPEPSHVRTSACANIVFTSNVPSYLESNETRVVPMLFIARSRMFATGESGACTTATFRGALNVSAYVKNCGPGGGGGGMLSSPSLSLPPVNE